MFSKFEKVAEKQAECELLEKSYSGLKGWQFHAKMTRLTGSPSLPVLAQRRGTELSLITHQNLNTGGRNQNFGTTSRYVSV